MPRWAVSDAIRVEGAEPILNAWRERDILTGRRVEIVSGHGRCDGRARGVNRDGFLVVEDARGEAHRIVNGEIRLVD